MDIECSAGQIGAVAANLVKAGLDFLALEMAQRAFRLSIDIVPTTYQIGYPMGTR